MNDSTSDIASIIQIIGNKKVPYEQVKTAFDNIDPTKYGSRYQDWVPDFDYVYCLMS